MESETSFVRTQRRVELSLAEGDKTVYLNSVPTVNFHFTLVILPDNTELDDAFGDLKSIALKSGSTVTTDTTFFNSGCFSKRVLLSSVDKISSLAYSLEMHKHQR